MKIRLHGLFIVLALIGAISTHAATILWTNSASFTWSNPLNWSPNQVPGAYDTAVITNVGNYTVTLDVNANVAGLILGASSGVAMQNFYTGGQTLTVNGPIQVTTQGQFNLNGGVIAGTNGLTGTLTCNAGSMEGAMTVSSNGVLNIVAGNNFFDGLVLTNYGTVNWANASLLGYGPRGNATIYNYGLWNAQSDNTFSGGYAGGASLFDNFGTFRKSGNTGATVLDSAVVFNNTGNVEIESGTLNIEGPGVNNGGYLTTANSGIINLYSFAFTNSTTLIGSGSYLVGDASFGGTIAGTLTWVGGSLSGNLTLASNAVLNTVAGNNAFTGLVLTNYGTVNWTNATLLGASGLNATIYNYGLWNAQSDNTFSGGYNGGTSLFDNFGTFRKSGKTGVTTLDSAVVFNNTGTVDVQNGKLEIGAGKDSAGTASTASNASLGYNNYAFAGGTTFTGAGLWC